MHLRVAVRCSLVAPPPLFYVFDAPRLGSRGVGGMETKKILALEREPFKDRSIESQQNRNRSSASFILHPLTQPLGHHDSPPFLAFFQLAKQLVFFPSKSSTVSKSKSSKSKSSKYLYCTMSPIQYSTGQDFPTRNGPRINVCAVYKTKLLAS